MNIEVILNNYYFKQFLLWCLLGLGIGVASKVILPGNENMGWIKTILLGLAGSVIGNLIAPRLFHWPMYSTFSWQGILIGVGFSMVLVLINKLVTKT